MYIPTKEETENLLTLGWVTDGEGWFWRAQGTDRLGFGKTYRQACKDAWHKIKQDARRDHPHIPA